MKTPPPVTVSDAEIHRALDERYAGADAARQDRLVALQDISTVRIQNLKQELKRLTQKHGADHSLVLDARIRLQANSNSLDALHFEIQRTSLRPPQPIEDAWTVFGIVRAKDGTPLADVVVVFADADGQVIQPDKAVATRETGAFSIGLQIAQPKARGAKAQEPEELDTSQAGNLHLEVFTTRNKRIGVDTVQLRPTAGVVDYRDFRVASPGKVKQ